MNSEILFTLMLAFTTGFLGSGHCLGMCGGLVSGFFMRFQNRSFTPYLIYHFVRVFIYGIIGFVAASLGEVLIATGQIGLAQAILQIIAGTIIVLLGWEFLGRSPISKLLGYLPTSWLTKQFIQTGKYGLWRASAIGGAINAFMPCPLTLAMAFQATTAPTPISGLWLMLAFGCGTLPSMLSASWLFGKLGVNSRRWLSKGAAIIVIIMGIITTWNGYRYFLVIYRLIN